MRKIYIALAQDDCGSFEIGGKSCFDTYAEAESAAKDYVEKWVAYQESIGNHIENGRWAVQEIVLED